MTFGRQFVWGCGGLSWIPTTLSTLRSVTSPRLSALRLDFSNSHLADRSIETLIQGTGDDLRQVADEVARIEREFEGAVSLTVVSDPVFKVVFDTLGVRFSFVMLTELPSRADTFSLTPCRYFSTTVIECDLQFPLSIYHSAVLGHSVIQTVC